MKFSDFQEKAHAPKYKKMSGDRWYRLERLCSVRISWMLYKLFPSITATWITSFSFVLLASVLILFSWMEPRMSETNIYIALLQLVLLYMITITDKIDGEIARVTEYSTQKGLYYDRLVHFMYPIILYLVPGVFFYYVSGTMYILYATIAVALMTQAFIFFGEARLLIMEKARKEPFLFKDIRSQSVKTSKATRPFVLWRLLDYTTFMVYAWTPLVYGLLIMMTFWDSYMAYGLYWVHIGISALITGHKVFYSYPHKKLLTQEEVDRFSV